MFNIELVELIGFFKIIIKGGFFIIWVKGFILGEVFDFWVMWSLWDVLGFVVGFCKELWDRFMENVLELFEVSK